MVEYLGKQVYVGIDQSYTGLAITFFSKETGKHSTLRKAFPAPKHGNGVTRLRDIQKWVIGCLQEYSGICAIGMEGYAHGAKFGREQAGELGAIIKLCAYAVGHNALAVAPTAVKKYATGKGNAKKNEILLNVYKRWDVEFDNDNDADSYVIARIMAQLDGNPDESLLGFQREVIQSLS